MPKGGRWIPLEGKTFGKWKVLRLNKREKSWQCECECGNRRLVKSQSLRNGSSKGCKVCSGREVMPSQMRGIEYGWLTPLRYAGERRRGSQGRSVNLLWLCRCRCGREVPVQTGNLRNGHSKSCGECGYQEMRVAEVLTTHGHTTGGEASKEYQMFCRAKERAKAKGVPFEIDIEDIVIPTHCPVFGWKLVHNDDYAKPNSPSLDRIHPERGYVRGNIWVISNKANTIKSDSTLEQLESLVAALQKKLKEEG